MCDRYKLSGYYLQLHYITGLRKKIFFRGKRKRKVVWVIESEWNMDTLRRKSGSFSLQYIFRKLKDEYLHNMRYVNSLIVSLALFCLMKKRLMKILYYLNWEKNRKWNWKVVYTIRRRLEWHTIQTIWKEADWRKTRSIYETRTIGVNDGYEKIDDIIETVNHFRCFDYILSIADKELSEDIIKHIQLVLKSGTLDSEKECAICNSCLWERCAGQI